MARRVSSKCEIMIEARLREITNIAEKQFVFRPGKSTNCYRIDDNIVISAVEFLIKSVSSFDCTLYLTRAHGCGAFCIRERHE